LPGVSCEFFIGCRLYEGFSPSIKYVFQSEKFETWQPNNESQEESEMDYALKTVENILKNSLTSESEMAPQPAHIRLPLKIHQRALVHAARALETNRPTGITCEDGAIMYTKYGVIADRVGSGKSLVALSLAGMERPQTEMFTAEASNNHDVVVIKKHDETKRLLARDYIMANTFSARNSPFARKSVGTLC
jgi:hypothetical protein